MAVLDKPILYSFRRCPYAMRARMGLDAAKIAVEHREVRLRDKPQAMLDASPKGSVPVLVLTDGTVIDESIDILEYALSVDDPEEWARDREKDRADAEAFLDQFKHHLDRYKYASRYDPDVERGAVDLGHRKQAMDLLADLSQPLDNHAFLRGGRPRLIDIALFPFVRQFAAVERDWWKETASKGLQVWLSHWLNDSRFKRIMTKHPVWEPDHGTET